MSDPVSRLEQLESRYAWLERHVAEQDREMMALGETVRRLKEELELMRAAGRGSSPGAESPEAPEPPPPHY